MRMELAQETDFSVALTREDFTGNMKFPQAPPKLYAGRKDPLSTDETKMRQRKLGGFCRAATVSRPGTCAR